MQLSFKDKFLNRTLVYTIGEFFVKGSKFLLLPFYTRVFTVEEFGILQQIIIISALLGFLIDFSSKESLLKLYYDYREDEKEKQFVGSIILAISFFSLIFLFCSIILYSGSLLVIEGTSYFSFTLYIIGYTYLLSLSNLALTIF